MLSANITVVTVINSFQETEVLDKEEEGQSEQESEVESSEYEEYTGNSACSF